MKTQSLDHQPTCFHLTEDTFLNRLTQSRSHQDMHQAPRLHFSARVGDEPQLEGQQSLWTDEKWHINSHKHVQKETAWGNTAMALMKRPAIEQYAIICHRWFCFIYFEKQPLRESDSWALCWLCICFMTRFWFTKGCWGFRSLNFACHPQSVKDRASIHVLSQDYGEWKASSSLLNPWSTLKTVCNMIKMKHDMCAMCACSSLFSLDSAIHPLVSHRLVFGVWLDLGTPSAWKRPARIKQPTTWRSGSSSRLPRNWFLSFTRTSLWLAPLES